MAYERCEVIGILAYVYGQGTKTRPAAGGSLQAFNSLITGLP